MWALFKRTIKDRKTVILIYIIASLAFLLMHISIFPSFKDQQVQFDQILKTMPEGFTKAFNLQDFNLSVFENYISTEEFSLIWPLLLAIMAISFAGGMIASEIEKGTIEVLLSQPISRTKLFLSRYLAGLSLIISFILVTISATVIMAKLFSISLQISHYPTLAFIGFIFGWAIFSITIFLSAIFSDKGKVYFISAGLLILMYALNIASGLKENLDKIKYLSFFHYYNPADALIRNKIDDIGVWVFLAIIIIFTVAGLIAFDRRDIAT